MGINKSNIYVKLEAGETATMVTSQIGLIAVQVSSMSSEFFLVITGINGITIANGEDTLSLINESGKINLSISENVITFKNNTGTAHVVRAYYFRLS